MKNASKLCVIFLFAIVAWSLLMNTTSTQIGVTVLARTAVTPTPVATPPAAAPAPTPPAGGKTITKEFILSKDSLSEWGESPFNHENHASKKYSPDGKSVVGCVECHHTDQPKSALKPPLLTSEREITLTLATFNASDQKVSQCRSCHFQDGNVPEDKQMPTATYNEGGKSITKDLNNEIAYHINCNVCHDAAFAARPELKTKPGFATSKDCAICHKKN